MSAGANGQEYREVGRVEGSGCECPVLASWRDCAWTSRGWRRCLIHSSELGLRCRPARRKGRGTWAPYAPGRPRVEGCGELDPPGGHVCRSPQQARPLLLLCDAEDRFNQPGSPPRCVPGPGVVAGHDALAVPHRHGVPVSRVDALAAAPVRRLFHRPPDLTSEELFVGQLPPAGLRQSRPALIHSGP